MIDLQLIGQPGLPLYQRVARSIHEAVRTGQLNAGDRLPSKTNLAERFGVNMVTIGRGYALLQQQGVVSSRRGSGTYIQTDAQERVRSLSARTLKTLWLVMGADRLADCRRETRFIVADLFDGLQESLGGERTAFRFTRSLSEQHMADIGEQDGVLVRDPLRCDLRFLIHLIDRQIPVVMTRAFPPGPLGILEIAPLITYDRAAAAELVCRHLIQRGHQQIGFIGNMERDSAKFLAYVQCMHAAGLNITARFVQEADATPGRAYAAVRRIIRGGAMPQALFVDTDFKAMEVIGALRDEGLHVPRDIAVAGFDGVTEAQTFDPPLTTVVTPRREIGQRAGELLTTWPTSGSPPRSQTLTCTLVVRASTGGDKLNSNVIEPGDSP